MRKILTVILCLVLLGSCLPVTADQPAVVTCTPSTISLERGVSFFVTVSVENSPTVNTMALTFGDAWDDSVFELVSAEWLISGATLKDVDAAKNNAVIMYSKPRSFDGDVFQLELRVKDTSGIGITAISVGAVFESDKAGHGVTPIGCEVEIVCRHTWTAADCAYPEYCAACGTTRGEPLGHAYEGDTCTRCGQTQQQVVATATTTLPTQQITTTLGSAPTGSTTAVSTGRQPGTTGAQGSTQTTVIVGHTGTTTGQTGTATQSTATTSAAVGSTGTSAGEQENAEDAVTLPENKEGDKETTPLTDMWVLILLCGIVVLGIGAGVIVVLVSKKK